MKLGAAQWKLKWNPPFEPVLDQIADLGLSAVELVAWDENDLRENFSPVRADALRAHADSLGLEISGFVGSPDGLADPDRAVRDRSVDYFANVIEVAKRLGTRLVVATAPYPLSIPIPWLPPRASAAERRIDLPSGLNWESNWSDYVDATKRCAELCESAEMVLAIEPHPHRYVSNAASMLRLIDHVGSEALGCNVDPCHLLTVCEIPQVAVYQLGSRVYGCHVSDGWGDANAHVAPGKGQTDWHAFVRALRDVGFDGALSIELDNLDGTQRGPASTTDDSVPDPEFLAENRFAAEYLREVAAAEGTELT